MRSQARKSLMFEALTGSILLIVCAIVLIPGIIITGLFSLRSKSELKSAIDACLKLSSKGDCFAGPHGPIGKWDVSRVTSTNFNGDTLKWDVSRWLNIC